MIWASIALITMTQTLRTDISEANIMGVWSEFGCAQDQIHIKDSGKITMKLWAGDEYGWLQQFRYWSMEENAVIIRTKKPKNSDIVEQWTITQHTSDQLIIKRDTDDYQRRVHLKPCDAVKD